jgi:predicted Zn finger-like uncharacterized protein
MSLTTRCPACETTFKIVPDQLKVSSGWVRCGRCAEVFDAAAYAASPNIAENWPLQDPVQTIQTTQTTKSNQAVPNQTTSAVNTQIIGADNNLPKRKDSSSEVSLVTNKVDAADLTFVRIANSKAFWQRTAVVHSLGAVCVVLVGLVFFQFIYSQRNYLAAVNPRMKSGLDSLCNHLGCRIQALKNIDSFKIDSSSFQKSQATASDLGQTEVFALKLAIKNTSDLPLALPSVELTLTEAGDKPVLRRVLLPKDLSFNEPALAANTDWNGSMAIAVSPNKTSPPITGYRVLLFYP